MVAQHTPQLVPQHGSTAYAGLYHSTVEDTWRLVPQHGSIFLGATTVKVVHTTRLVPVHGGRYAADPARPRSKVKPPSWSNVKPRGETTCPLLR
eukprot:823067-Rhodomonas_salina.4